MNRLVMSCARQAFRTSFIASGRALCLRHFATEAANANEAITMTPECAKHIQKIAKTKKLPLENVHLRIHVESGGCSGLQYKFTMDYDKVYDYDKEFVDASGARLVVDTVSFPYVKGCVVGWQDDLLRTGFSVEKNPNAAESCSCGSSFTAKSDSRYD
ncbi:hypothetical protein WA538_002863, partial [Blastocystis sp. DL]